MTKRKEKLILKPFTKEEDEILTREWATGTIAKDIGKLINRSVSSVRGRVGRLGLQQRTKGAWQIRTRTVREKIVGRPKDIYIAYGTPKPLLDVGRDECRFPIEGTNNYCCGDVTKGAYCQAHFAVSRR